MEEEDEFLQVDTIALDRASDGSMYVIPTDQRRTINRVSKFEAAAIISLRAKQIDAGMQYFACLDGQNMGNLFASRIAVLEFNQGRCPINIARPVGTIDPQGHQHYEIWSPNEMEREFVNPDSVGE